MTIDNQTDLDGIIVVGRVVARVRDAMLDAVEPGMTTRELDRIGSALLEDAGAQSAPSVVYGFPGATCISINEQAAHGVPGSRVICAGDVVNVGVSAELNGYFADTGGTTVVPPVAPAAARLCRATRMALARATSQARAGASTNRRGDFTRQGPLQSCHLMNIGCLTM